MPHLTNSELEQHKEEKEEVAKNIGIDLRQFSIEELYSAWIRNVLIILCATIGVFSMYNHCQDTCELYHKIALSLLLITVLLMLISSSIDYKNRIKQLRQENPDYIKPHIHDITTACAIIWIVVVLMVIVVIFKK